MDIQTAAKALEGQISNGNSILCRGVGHSKHDRSLSVTFSPDAPEGFSVHSFAGDDWKDCRDYVKERLGIASDYQTTNTGAAHVAPNPEPSQSQQAKRIAAKQLWVEGKPITGTIAERYLLSRVGSLPQGLIETGSLRWHSMTGALLAYMIEPLTGDFVGVHRTFFDKNGNKTGRFMLGGSGVVKLIEDEGATLSGLALAEGIETTLAAAKKFNLSPVWATLTAGNMKKFPVLDYIQSLTCFADHDENETGQKAALECVSRYLGAGREAFAYAPLSVGDFADRKAA